MKRKLAPEALYSSESYHPTHGGYPNDIPAMERFTVENIEKIDPGRHRALAILKEYEQEQTPQKN